jgi:hypothetical protein
VFTALAHRQDWIHIVFPSADLQPVTQAVP